MSEPHRTVSTPDEDDAILAGAYAKRRDLDASANPFDQSDPLHNSWLQGWRRPGMYIGDPEEGD